MARNHWRALFGLLVLSAEVSACGSNSDGDKSDDTASSTTPQDSDSGAETSEDIGMGTGVDSGQESDDTVLSSDTPQDTGTSSDSETSEEIDRSDWDTLVGEATNESDLETLVDWMAGKFESKDKAGQKEPEGFYTYIWAELRQIRIWRDKTDGYWLYVEQNEHGQTPYRVRIYNVRIADGTTYVVDNYKIPYADSTKYSDTFDDPTIFDDLVLEDISTHNAECNVILKKQGNAFYGRNDPQTCLANMGTGNIKMDSFSIIRDGTFYSHDMGFDPSSGQQVIGPTSIGYTFVELEDYPL